MNPPPFPPTTMHTTTPIRRALPRALPLLLLLAAPLAAEPETLARALAEGTVSLHLRARYEGVEQTGLRDATALTLRTRLGYTTAPLHGLRAMVEFENIASPDGDRFNQAGRNPGGAGRAVVADPEGTEINQAWLAYSRAGTTATLGRLRLNLDNTRFVGDVGWRQNMQTFDGVALVSKPRAPLTLHYAYLDRIHRVFGDRLATGRWASDSHLFNASYAGLKAGTLTGYAYLLDFANAATQSTATYGLSFAGATPLRPTTKLTYRAEYATQTDHGASPLRYSADYLAFELGLAAKPGALAVGYEELGGARGGSFRTPLATLHAFNGWADLFLTTPGNGLRDAYVKLTAPLPAAVAFVGVYHDFTADRLGADYGTELDLQLSRKFGPAFTATVKSARFRRHSLAFPDVTKLWVQLEFVH